MNSKVGPQIGPVHRGRDSKMGSTTGKGLKPRSVMSPLYPIREDMTQLLGV